MAAGPPKKPVGLLKKSNVAERAEQEAAANAQARSKTETVTESQEESMAKAKASLANILNQPVSKGLTKDEEAGDS